MINIYIKTVDSGGVNADLTLNIDGFVDINSATGEDITLDSGGGITLDADGGSIYFKDDTTTFATFTKGGSTKLTLASVGVLNLDSGTDIILDSHTGNFIAKKAGTEFSATNSAYAGMILGYTRIANNGTGGTDSVITPNGTMTVLQTGQGTDVKVTFIAPPSECVEIQFSCVLYTNTTTVAFALSSAASFAEVDETHTYDAGSYKMDETDVNTIVISWAITTGLTAGTSYTYYIAAEETVGSTSSIYHGRFRTSGTHYAPIIVKATALLDDGQSPDHFFTGE